MEEEGEEEEEEKEEWYERIFVTVRLRLNCYQVFLGVV